MDDTPKTSGTLDHGSRGTWSFVPGWATALDSGSVCGSAWDHWLLIYFYKAISTLHSADVRVEGGKDDCPCAAMLDHTLKDRVQEGIHLHLSHLSKSVIFLSYNIWVTFVSSVPSLMVCPYLTLESINYFTRYTHPKNIYDIYMSVSCKISTWAPLCWIHRMHWGMSGQTPKKEMNHVPPSRRLLRMSGGRWGASIIQRTQIFYRIPPYGFGSLSG